jgi:hypothetical protein
MVTSPPSFSSEYTERLFYPHQSIADCARIFNPAKAAKMGEFNAASGNTGGTNCVGAQGLSLASFPCLRSQSLFMGMGDGE